MTCCLKISGDSLTLSGPSCRLYLVFGAQNSLTSLLAPKSHYCETFTTLMLCFLPECVAGGGEGEDDLERGQVVSERQDSGHDEVVQGHPQGHLLSAQDPLQYRSHLLH